MVTAVPQHRLIFNVSCLGLIIQFDHYLYQRSHHGITIVMCRAVATVQSLKLPAWKVGDHGFEPRYDIQVSKKQRFFFCSLVKIQYCEEPPWPRSSELGLWPPGFELGILREEGSVISFISPSSDPVDPICAQRWPIITPFIAFHCNVYLFLSTYPLILYITYPQMVSVDMYADV